MTTTADVERLQSLPSPLHDDDDGIAKAVARDAALDQDPESGVS